MTCASRTVDVYLEPFVQARVLVVGRRDARRRGAGAAGAQHGLPGRSGRRRGRAADVGEAAALGVKSPRSTRSKRSSAGRGGRGRSRSVAGALRRSARRQPQGRAPYVGLVASRKRAATIRALLEDGALSSPRSPADPAGLDLGARPRRRSRCPSCADRSVPARAGSRCRGGARICRLEPEQDHTQSGVRRAGRCIGHERATRRRLTASFIAPAARLPRRFVKQPQGLSPPMTDAESIRARFRGARSSSKRPSRAALAAHAGAREAAAD